MCFFILQSSPLNTPKNAYNGMKKTNPMLIFLFSASFYLYEFILQVAPSVMAGSMMQTFHVSAAGFGIVSAFYFYAYAPMQLPAGVLFDRYGPRKLMTLALCLCAAGSFFFASTDYLFTAAIGRFLIGIGSAFSFIGVLLLVSRWFPAKQFALLAGIAQLMSSIGAIFGEMPLAHLIEYVGWRYASFILALIGFALAGLMWRFIRDYPSPVISTGPRRSFQEEWQRLYTLCSKPNTWIIGCYAGAIWTPIAVFSVLWGVPYLQQKFGISVLEASGLCSISWVGIGIGSPLLGWISDHCRSRRLVLTLSAVLGLFASCLILYVPGITPAWMCWVLFMFGLGAGGQTVSFAVLRDITPPQLLGTASGFNNLAVLIGGAICQPLVGILLQRSQDWHQVNGIHYYSLSSYNHALSILPLSFLLSLIVSVFFIKESHPEAHASNR